MCEHLTPSGAFATPAMPLLTGLSAVINKPFIGRRKLFSSRIDNWSHRIHLQLILKWMFYTLDQVKRLVNQHWKKKTAFLFLHPVNLWSNGSCIVNYRVTSNTQQLFGSSFNHFKVDTIWCNWHGASVCQPNVLQFIHDWPPVAWRRLKCISDLQRIKTPFKASMLPT